MSTGKKPLKNKPKSAKTRPENKDALVRMWQLLKLIPQKPPGKTIKDMQENLRDAGFEVVEKTVKRNLETLSQVFPLTSDGAQPERWYWMPNRDSGLPGVALSEAIALLLVEKSLTGLIHRSQLEPLAMRIEAARRLVGSTNRTNPGASWVDKVASLPRDLAHQPPEVKPDISDAAQQALLTDKQLEINYKSFNDTTPRRRKLNPHALLLKVPVVYLIATEEPRDEDPNPVTKQYALHRIKSAHVLTTSTKHGSFDLKDYLAKQKHEIGTNEPINLKIEVHSRSMRTILEEVPISKNQRIIKDGEKFIVEALVRHTRALERWIYARGSEITLLEPTSIRERIAAELRKAASGY